MLSILEINQLYTYKQICEILEIPYKTGEAKMKQLSDLQHSYEYVKQGTKYLITKIKNAELITTDNRKVTSDNIKHILMATLSTLNDDEIYYASNKDLLKLCYMINNNYSALLNDSTNKYSVKKRYNFDDSFILYVNETYDILKPTLKRALDSMVKHMEISLSIGYKIVKDNKIINCVSEQSDLGHELFKIQGDSMSELGILDTKELYGNKIKYLDSYYDLCNKKAKELFNIDKFYRCYAIRLNTNKIKYDITQERNELNRKLHDKLHNTVRLRDLTYNQIENWYGILHTRKGDIEYPIEDYCKMLNSKKR